MNTARTTVTRLLGLIALFLFGANVVAGWDRAAMLWLVAAVCELCLIGITLPVAARLLMRLATGH